MNDIIYRRLVEDAAEETKGTGMVDLVAVTRALSQGYDANRFTRDVLDVAAKKD